MARIVVVTPNPLLDCLHDGDLIPGKVTRSSGLNVVAGGKGLNVGRVLKQHGHDIIATGFAGGWTGDAFRDIVQVEGQDDAFINCAARLRIGFQAKDCVNAGSTALLEHGFSVSEQEQQQLLEKLAEILPQCDLCIVSGSVPDSSCNNLFIAIAQLSKQHRVPCWIDSYGPAMDAVLQSDCKPDLAKPNKEEFETSAHWSSLAECHVTDGEKPTTIYRDGETLIVTPPEVECVNPIGSGDSYIAALAHARLSNWDLEKQLAYAAAAGAINASQMAIADMTPDEIQSMSNNVSVATS